MEMSKVKYQYSVSLFLGLLSVMIFVFWIKIPDKSYILFLLGIINLFTGRSFIAKTYKIIKEHYAERIAAKIRNRIRLWGVTITILISGVAHFYGPLLTVVIGLLLSLTLVISIYRKY